MSRCVIVGGAGIGDYEAVKNYLNPEDYYIFCDSGMKHRERLGVEPDLIVGDFDSWQMDDLRHAGKGSLNSELNYLESREEKPEVRTAGYNVSSGSPEILTLPHDKYDTDTVYGVREGIQRGYEEFLLIGVIGQRLDHSLSNLYILVLLDRYGKHGMIVDDYSEMELVSGRPGYVKDCFPYFSLVNITGTARHISIENARYCYLPGEEITCDYQYGISNEVIPGKTARITVGEGSLLLIRNRRELQ